MKNFFTLQYFFIIIKYTKYIFEILCRNRKTEAIAKNRKMGSFLRETEMSEQNYETVRKVAKKVPKPHRNRCAACSSLNKCSLLPNRKINRCHCRYCILHCFDFVYSLCSNSEQIRKPEAQRKYIFRIRENSDSHASKRTTAMHLNIL